MYIGECVWKISLSLSLSLYLYYTQEREREREGGREGEGEGERGGRGKEREREGVYLRGDKCSLIPIPYSISVAHKKKRGGFCVQHTKQKAGRLGLVPEEEVEIKEVTCTCGP